MIFRPLINGRTHETEVREREMHSGACTRRRNRSIRRRDRILVSKSVSDESPSRSSSRKNGILERPRVLPCARRANKEREYFAPMPNRGDLSSR